MSELIAKEILKRHMGDEIVFGVDFTEARRKSALSKILLAMGEYASEECKAKDKWRQDDGLFERDEYEAAREIVADIEKTAVKRKRHDPQPETE